MGDRSSFEPKLHGTFGMIENTQSTSQQHAILLQRRQSSMNRGRNAPAHKVCRLQFSAEFWNGLPTSMSQPVVVCIQDTKVRFTSNASSPRHLVVTMYLLSPVLPRSDKPSNTEFLLFCCVCDNAWFVISGTRAKVERHWSALKAFAENAGLNYDVWDLENSEKLLSFYLSAISPPEINKDCDIVLSSDDEENVDSTPVVKREIFQYPRITLLFSDNTQVTREANILIDLLRPRYLDSFALTPIIEHKLRHGRAFILNHLASQKVGLIKVLVEKHNLASLVSAEDAIRKLNECPSLRDDFKKNEELTLLLTDTTKEYTVCVVFDENGSHWYIAVIARLAQWLANGASMCSQVHPPVVYYFDSLAQDVKTNNGNNYKAVIATHQEFEKTLISAIRFGALVHFNNPILYQRKNIVTTRNVREVAGQSNSTDCGAFVLLYTHAIADGELVECKDVASKDFLRWTWISGSRLRPKHHNQRHDADLKEQRRLYYEFAKEMVISGREHLDEAERRLESGLPAFDGEPEPNIVPAVVPDNECDAGREFAEVGTHEKSVSFDGATNKDVMAEGDIPEVQRGDPTSTVASVHDKICGDVHSAGAPISNGLLPTESTGKEPVTNKRRKSRSSTHN